MRKGFNVFLSLLLVWSLVFPGFIDASNINRTENFNGLTDVNVPTPSDGDVAQFNSTSGLWESAANNPTEDYLLYQHDETSGTDGGGFTCGGGFVTRTLDTEVVDTGSNGTLATNAVTLLAGTYRFVGRAAAFDVNEHKLKLRNTTDATDVALGDSADASADVQTWSEVRGRFTIATSRTFELQHECTTTQAVDGFGQATSLGTEIYATLEFWREGSGPSSVGGFSGALVRKTAAQSIANSTVVALTFDAEEFDAGGWHDNVTNNARLTVPSGVTRVRVCGNVTFAAQAGGQRALFLQKNGAAFNGQYSTDHTDTGGSDSINGCTGPLSVVATDFFESNVFQDSGVAVDANTATGTWFSIEAIP